MTQPIPFGKYLLLERINVGGMAEVFKAKAFGIEGFERVIAIKRILPNMAEDEEFINMFIDEARIAVQLSHANIVPIFELGKLDSQYYIAMEYVAGKDLRQTLDRFRKREALMPQAASAYITAKICEGLDYAHRKTDATGRPLNVIHRDVSPQNILLGYDGSVKITDFGIVKAEDRASKTQAGVLKGKFGYMSPEQVRGLEIDQRSDIFAVGILLYEMATGKRLFIGESDFATLEKVRAAEVTPPREHNPEISEEFERVMLKALARERDERYRSAAELAEDLQQFLIADNTVYSGKRLQALMQEEYSQEQEAERQRMEDYLRMPAPSGQNQDALREHQEVPTSDWQKEGRTDRTIIFESDFSSTKELSSESLAQALRGDLTQVPRDERPTLAMDEGAGVAAVQAALGARAAEAKPSLSASRAKWFVALGATMLVAVVGLLVCWALWPGREEASLQVTAVPTDAVSIYLDGTLVGSRTPLTLEAVPTGEHRLLARAQGFREKAYRFDLQAGAPAEIKVELEREAQLVIPGETSLEVNSEPQSASVRMGGLPQGTTPVSLRHPDTAHPIVLEVSKPGFVTQQVTVTFDPAERSKAVMVRLVPVGRAPVQNPLGGGDDAPAAAVAASPVAPAEAATSKLRVLSKPPGAQVFIGGLKKGETPLDVADLSPSGIYPVQLVRDGFRTIEATVRMNNRHFVIFDRPMQPLRVVPPRARFGQGAPCSGSGGVLSLIAMDVGDCAITVGRQNLGVAPMYKKEAPQGRCVIDVRCPGNKHFVTTRVLRPGVEEKIIIKPDDWR